MLHCAHAAEMLPSFQSMFVVSRAELQMQVSPMLSASRFDLCLRLLQGSESEVF